MNEDLKNVADLICSKLKPQPNVPYHYKDWHYITANEVAVKIIEDFLRKKYDRI